MNFEPNIDVCLYNILMEYYPLILVLFIFLGFLVSLYLYESSEIKKMKSDLYDNPDKEIDDDGDN